MCVCRYKINVITSLSTINLNKSLIDIQKAQKGFLSALLETFFLWIQTLNRYPNGYINYSTVTLTPSECEVK
jgi:hypothetical protein